MYSTDNDRFTELLSASTKNMAIFGATSIHTLNNLTSYSQPNRGQTFKIYYNNASKIGNLPLQSKQEVFDSEENKGKTFTPLEK